MKRIDLDESFLRFSYISVAETIMSQVDTVHKEQLSLVLHPVFDEVLSLVGNIR